MNREGVGTGLETVSIYNLQKTFWDTNQPRGKLTSAQLNGSYWIRLSLATINVTETCSYEKNYYKMM